MLSSHSGGRIATGATATVASGLYISGLKRDLS